MCFGAAPAASPKDLEWYRQTQANGYQIGLHKFEGHDSITKKVDETADSLQKAQDAQDELDKAKLLKDVGKGAIQADFASVMAKRAAAARPLGRWNRGTSFLTGGSLLGGGAPPSLFPPAGSNTSALTQSPAARAPTASTDSLTGLRIDPRRFLRAVNGPKGLRSFLGGQ